MCKTKGVLAFLVLSVGLGHSWDFALTTGNQLEFYSNKTKIYSVEAQPRDLTALAYDAVHNMLLFVDKQSDNASIFSYHLATKKYHSLVRKKSYENIEGIAFDPVTEMLFWIDIAEKSIFTISTKNGAKNNGYGTLLLKMDDEIPRAIAVDSCRGYIYWTNINISKPTIERAKFDGSEREVVIKGDIYMPVTIAIDQQTKKLYWVDDREGIHYSVENSDLNGNNRKRLLYGIDHKPISLTVSKDSIYWVDSAFKTVWRLPKNLTVEQSEEPQEIVHFPNEVPFGIAANYNIKDQTEGIPECEALNKLSSKEADLDDSFGIPLDAGLFCVHGMKVDGKLVCKCSPGYTGDRCDTSVCQNYCFQGDCSLTSDGQPKCSCKVGYIGDRCEANVCHNYCLNNGACSLDKNHMPVCGCSTDYEGFRCETLKIITSTTELTQEPVTKKTIPNYTVVQDSTITSSPNMPSLTSEPTENNNWTKDRPQMTSGLTETSTQTANVPQKISGSIETSTQTANVPQKISGSIETSTQTANVPQNTSASTRNSETPKPSFISDTKEQSIETKDFTETCDGGWDPVRDPIIMLLGILSGLLSLSCAVLITKVLHLKRRPRIKKRIIVNKNVTPMTARPDQCEITIEDCCNMNICETPCFEPRSSIRPTLLGAKPGKEEKRNLIANMEYPDDHPY